MEKKWISVRETSRYLGIHPITVRRLVDRGQIKAVKIGGSIRIDLKRLDEQLQKDIKQQNK